jgi:sulfur-oxidizing protein SoxZ
MGKAIKVRAKVKGDIAEVKALMPHEMESGRRRDPETNELVPAHFISDVVVEHNGETVLTAYWSTAVSKNPYLAFSFGGATAGDKIFIRWQDSSGDSSEVEATLK